ncbi:MerR family transcriptional regulator [Paenibacillus harenae]|uniref:MerR family transcriptional regulator n=1 Tax=Paenibacillus harenae TaxID=306543 RepID=UPI0004202E87|nr:MerR family transcriptional regulator [Paenibacillus harenae]
MGALKTKDAADLISVSQTTIKRWASTFPDCFQKDRFGHYIFSEHDIGLLKHIKERIDHGDHLDSIHLNGDKKRPASRQEETPPHADASAAEELLTRIEQVERSLQQKADEVVSVQLRGQREELEELRQMIVQLAAAVETIQTPSVRNRPVHDETHPAAAKPQASPKKRGLLRSIFTFL